MWDRRISPYFLSFPLFSDALLWVPCKILWQCGALNLWGLFSGTVWIVLKSTGPRLIGLLVVVYCPCIIHYSVTYSHCITFSLQFSLQCVGHNVSVISVLYPTTSNTSRASSHSTFQHLPPRCTYTHTVLVARWRNGYTVGPAGSNPTRGNAARQPWASCSHLCASVTKQYNLVPAKGWWCSVAGEVTAGLAESNESLPAGGWFTVTCQLTAWTPGSAPGLTFGIEYGKAFFYCISFYLWRWCRM